MIDVQRQVILRKRPSGVAVVLFDCAGKVNLLTSAVMQEFGETLQAVARDKQITGLMIVSGKHDTFLSGADLKEITRTRSAEEAAEMSRRGQMVMGLLFDLPVPTAVGIHGHCLGGGLELALCCDRRLATDHPSTLIGLPEVKMGIVPGLGGTQRLPRVAGLKGAIEIILGGDPVDARRALELSVVDELTDPDHLLARLEEMVLEMVRAGDGPRGRDRDRTAGELTPEKQKSLLAMAERSVRIRTKGHYPAPSRAVELMRRGLELGVGPGMEDEAAAFGELAVSNVSRNLVSLFFATEFTRQTAQAVADRITAGKVRRIAILGGGKMGISIAQLAALNGIDVILRSRNAARADAVKEDLAALFARLAQKSKHNPGELEAAMARIVATADDAQLSSVDLVLEALPEELETKAAGLAQVSGIVSPDCLIASNTSSLPLPDIFAGAARPERCLGLHFFHPVEHMPLVEIVAHSGAGKDSLARATAFVASIGKTPLAVSDSPGFLVNRLLTCYLLETARLAEEHVPLNWIEDAALEFGMPLGPIELMDEVGLDVSFRVAHALNESLGAQFELPEVIGRVQQHGLVGKKTGRGFYSYDESGRKLSFAPELTGAVGLKVSESKAGQAESARITARLILPMVDEAARCLKEKVVRKAREIDMAMVMGVGFPPFRGGPLKYADHLGIPAVRQQLTEIYQATGGRRRVSEYIAELEEKGRRFYALSADDGAAAG